MKPTKNAVQEDTEEKRALCKCGHSNHDHHENGVCVYSKCGCGKFVLNDRDAFFSRLAVTAKHM